MPSHKQIKLFDVNEPWKKRTPHEVLSKLEVLQAMHKRGLLGGEVMPEDANPQLEPGCSDNYHYFTLCMALNYQRNSYTLWKSATRTYEDLETRLVFNPEDVAGMKDSVLCEKLMKHRLALQQNRHIDTWKRISESICKLLGGDVRELFKITCSEASRILTFVQDDHKKMFPYLSGPKICNYWLYVMSQYTDCGLTNREALNVAPDTHIIQATIRLGLVEPERRTDPNIQELVSEVWHKILAGTQTAPIDIHTVLWLWSRGGFVTARLCNK